MAGLSILLPAGLVSPHVDANDLANQSGAEPTKAGATPSSQAILTFWLRAIRVPLRGHPRDTPGRS